MTESFGTTKKGEKCQLFRLRNQKGMEAHITDYGATVVRLYVPDREGDLVDVVLGYEDGCISAELKNKFSAGQSLDCLEPKSVPFAVPADELLDGDGNPIETAAHPMMKIKIPFYRPVKAGSGLSMKTE